MMKMCNELMGSMNMDGMMQKGMGQPRISRTRQLTR